ncbi:MAG TPA: glutaminyl-peptide cyclotransferase [Flavisolibacter sp.]|nr:glutaminyl-peptide cyclotransferase [Flavisolibacter sp.]
MRRFSPVLAAILLVFMIGCNDGPEQPDTAALPPPVPVMSYRILATHPHDTSSFTEGLEFYQNTLLESTGEHGKSKLIRTDLASGKALQEVSLDPKLFGEGLTVLNDTLYQLTYKENRVLVYDARTFNKIGELPLKGEGWGLTNDGKSLIASNGSSDLFFYDPKGFTLQKTLPVRESGSVVLNINELEYVNGFIYANQWQYSYILKIDANTGEVVSKLDLTDLVNKVKATEPWMDTLNGIAYDPTTKKFYITGKNWSKLYEIQFGN